MLTKRLKQITFMILIFVTFASGTSQQMVKISQEPNSSSHYSKKENSDDVTKVSARNVELEKAIKHYQDAEFQKAIDLLERLVITKQLSKEDHREALEYLAMLYCAEGQVQKAKAIFKEILDEDCNYRPSENWWPHQRLMDVFYEMLKGCPVPQFDSKIKTIAFIDFDNASVENFEKYQNLGKALAKMISSDFGNLNNLKIVEREHLSYLLRELDLSKSDLTNPEYRARIGKLMSAQSFVFGSFTQIGKTFRIDVRVVKTETSERIVNTFVEGKPKKITKLAKKLTLKIIEDLEVVLEGQDKEKIKNVGKEAIPIDAIALYGDAMTLASGERYEEAAKKIQAALEMAPNFQKAEDLMRFLQPFAKKLSTSKI